MAKRRLRTFIKEWRTFRGLSQETLAELAGMSSGNLSLIERGLQNYTQETLEALAGALKCDPVDLLAREPTDPEGIWSVWDKAKPGERAMIVDIAKTIIKTNT
jgi:transcriptional regulator with XRE-family HTH domain